MAAAGRSGLPVPKCQNKRFELRQEGTFKLPPFQFLGLRGWILLQLSLLKKMCLLFCNRPFDDVGLRAEEPMCVT